MPITGGATHRKILENIVADVNYPFLSASDRLKRSVFIKGAVIEGYSASVWRRDICGRAMKYAEHGIEGKFGWEIDHIKPVADGGGDELSNLQPLWWENNRRKGNNYPWSG